MYIEKQPVFILTISILAALSGACGGKAEVQHPPKNPNFQLELAIASAVEQADSSYKEGEPSVYVQEHVDPNTGQTFKEVYRLTGSKLTFGQRDIVDVRTVKDEIPGTPRYNIMVTFSEDAKKRLAHFTGENISKTCLVFVNKQFVNAPKIAEKIEAGALWIGYRAKPAELREILKKDYQVSLSPDKTEK
jgi:preprotein translocase subunit SecD